jgi:hypothetical protein
MDPEEIDFLMERARRSRMPASMTLDHRMMAALLKAADEYEAEANRLKHKPAQKPDHK